MPLDSNYDLTVSCVQFDLVDSPGADTEDQETESCRLTVSRDGSPYGLGAGAGAGACQGCRGCSGACPHQCSTCHHSAYTGLQARLPGLTQKKLTEVV